MPSNIEAVLRRRGNLLGCKVGVVFRFFDVVIIFCELLQPFRKVEINKLILRLFSVQLFKTELVKYLRASERRTSEWH